MYTFSVKGQEYDPQQRRKMDVGLVTGSHSSNDVCVSLIVMLDHHGQNFISSCQTNASVKRFRKFNSVFITHKTALKVILFRAAIVRNLIWTLST